MEVEAEYGRPGILRRERLAGPTPPLLSASPPPREIAAPSPAAPPPRRPASSQNRRPAPSAPPPLRPRGSSARLRDLASSDCGPPPSRNASCAVRGVRGAAESHGRMRGKCCGGSLLAAASVEGVLKGVGLGIPPDAPGTLPGTQNPARRARPAEPVASVLERGRVVPCSDVDDPDPGPGPGSGRGPGCKPGGTDAPPVCGAAPAPIHTDTSATNLNTVPHYALVCFRALSGF